MLSWELWELEAWAGYYMVEPFGEQRGDWRIARLAAMVASLGGRAKKVETFMWKPPKHLRKPRTEES